MTNPVTGNLRVPMVVLVVGSLVALMVHVRVGMDSE
jgi:hypothetical protein